MKAKTPTQLSYTLALVSTFIAICTHAYLTYRHFEVTLGHDLGDSFCNINATFNCDTVAASSFSSLLGIPLALWGLVTNLVLFLLALTVRMTWDGQAGTSARWLIRLSTVVLLATIVMGTVSITQLKVYCPFCILTYALSIVTFAGFFLLSPASLLGQLREDIKALFVSNRLHLTMLGLIPVFAWLLNGIFHSQYKTSQSDLAKFIEFQTADWKANPTFDFSSVSGLSTGSSAENAKMTIYEFADFLCSHCRDAFPKLEAFVESHSNVRLVFFNFPLDGDCNESISQKVGKRCQLAKAVICAGEKAWPVHHHLFEHQEKLHSADMDSELVKMSELFQLPLEEWKLCMNSEATHQVLLRQIKAGVGAGVKGTPAIYVNGRKLLGGQNIPMLKAAYDQL